MWIIAAWQRISPEVTLKCFKKFCISSAVVESGGCVMEWQWRGWVY